MIDILQKDQFGNAIVSKTTRRQKFEDYEAFTDKFKPKLTTDDCYTPPSVYEAVKGWVMEHSERDISGLRVVRPFKPGGDYEHEDYTGAMVIDNPPFSILAQIKLFYMQRDIPFFLFAPALTLFTSYIKGLTYLPIGANVIYENGANVSTSFISNLFPSKVIKVDHTLYDAIKKANEAAHSAKPRLPKYVYPDNVIRASVIHALAAGGEDFEVRPGECAYMRNIDAARRIGKGIFGNGFLVSEAKAKEAKAKEAKLKEARTITLGLTDEERKIIAALK